ncbi:transporter substrate-binding domain-containing protein [Legionella sp. CNM-4043-24]|uniref:transporter substrate-binding domain-containing protein n=1 Tax=Legionella sp. CNM-4043-24 TaxID=3421646 RepID=UPI00403AF6BD
MKTPGILAGLVLFFGTALHAADLPPLNVAVDTFSPAFVMQANKQLYGFDISMMESICKSIQRQCVFQPMPFSQLIDSVESGKYDVAVGSIAISPDRAARVNFSDSYLASMGRFVTLKKNTAKPFTLTSLNNQTIGVEKGSMFAQALASFPIVNPKIIEYPSAEAMIDAMKNDEITYAVAPNPGALFWQSQTSGEFAVLGQPFNYGFGLGIAVNKSDMDLLNQINKALAQYLVSPEYKANYNSYLNFF